MFDFRDRTNTHCGLQVTEEEGTVFAPQTARLSCGEFEWPLKNGCVCVCACEGGGGGGSSLSGDVKKVFSISNSVPITLTLS